MTPIEFSREVLTSDDPMSNQERIALWRRKHEMVRLEVWWTLTHPGDDGIVVDPWVGSTTAELPAFLRRQAE